MGRVRLSEEEQKQRKEKNKEYAKIYYQKNKQKVLERQKLQRRGNRKRLDKAKEYYYKKREKYLAEASSKNITIRKKRSAEEIKERRKIYKANNKEKILEQARLYYIKNKKTIRPKQMARKKERYHNDIMFAKMNNIRTMIRECFRRKGMIKPYNTVRLLGCTINEFKQHIESQFIEGMSWDNRSEWHIDHIVPIALATSIDEVVKLSNYINLQPLWAKDNMAKSDKLYNKELAEKLLGRTF